MVRCLTFVFGLLMCSIGIAFMFLYLNLITMGYSFWEYVKFIISRMECNCVFVGIILILLTVRWRRKNEIFLRCLSKHE